MRMISLVCLVVSLYIIFITAPKVMNSNIIAVNTDRCGYHD